MSDFAYLLKCSRCGKEEYLGITQAVRRLVSVGMLKREKEPGPDLIVELLKSALPKLACRSCASLEQTLQEQELWDDGVSARKKCQQCGNPIDPDRLEVFPTATLCVACQHGEEAGLTPATDEVDYCPRCGNVMEVRKSTSGIARYFMFCPSCSR